MRAGRLVRWSGIVVVTLIILPATTLLFLDVNIYRNQLESLVTKAFDRPVIFDGDMSLALSFRPRVKVARVRIANPDWASRPYIAEARRLNIQVALIPLLRGEWKFLRLDFEEADVLLERGPEGANNWTFRNNRKPREFADIESLLLRDSSIRYRTADGRIYQFAVSQAKAAATVDLGIRFEAAGSYRNTPFTLSFHGGTLAEFFRPTQPWPINLKMRTAGASIAMVGTVAQPADWQGLNSRIVIRGKRPGKPGPLVGGTLRTALPYQFSGAIIAFDRNYSISEITGSIGDKSRLRVTGGTASIPSYGPIEFLLEGAYAGVPFNVSLVGGTFQQMTAPHQAWPITIKALAAGTVIDATGKIGGTIGNADVNARITIQGKRFDALDALLGVELPALGAYKLSGLVLGAGDAYRVVDLKSDIDGSDISGTLSFNHAAPRPLLTAELTSQTFRIDKLTGYRQGRGSSTQEKGYLDRIIRTKGLKAIDTNIKWTVKRVIGGPGLIRDVILTARLENGQLSISPFRASLPGARIKGHIDLDARGRIPTLALTVSSNGINAGNLLKAFTKKKNITGDVTGLRIKLISSGRTIRALVKHSTIKLTTGAAVITRKDNKTGDFVTLVLKGVEATIVRGGPIACRVDGMLRNVPFALNVSGGTLGQLLADAVPWPVHLSARALGSSINAKGIVVRPLEVKGADIRFELVGQQLNTLGALLEIDLPRLGPYRFTGRFTTTDGTYRITRLKGQIRNSDISGDMTVSTDGRTPHIAAKLRARKIHLAEIIKYNSNSKTRQDNTRLIPDTTIPILALRGVDAELDLSADRVVLESVDLTNLDLNARLEKGRLTVTPFSATLSGGTLSGHLDLNATGRTPKIDLKTTVQGLDYGQLFRSMNVVENVEGTVDVDIEMKGNGATLRQFASHAYGQIQIVSGPGRITDRLLDLWAADMISTMFKEGWRREQITKLNCMVGRFDLVEGLAKSDALLMDTTRITVAGSMTIDLDTEKIDGLFKPAPKNVSLISLAVPVRITGTLASHKVSTTGLGRTRMLGGLWLGLINPVALVMVFGHIGTGNDNPCFGAINSEASAFDFSDSEQSVTKKTKRLFHK